MNTDTIEATAAGALVIDRSDDLSFLVWIGAGILVVLFGTAIAMAFTLEEHASLAAVPALGGLFFATPFLMAGLNVSGNDGLLLDDDRVETVISERYRITSVEAAAESDGPTAAQLCKAVSTKSPEYIGIADGQQIRFKAGSTNCESDDPDITIIVTDTPGAALSADDLRKADTTEES